MTDSSGTVRHLAIGAGKDANIYLVDRDNMGKFNPLNNSNVYQELNGALSGGIWSMPAYYNGMVDFGAVGNSIQAFQFSQALLVSTPASVTSHQFPYPGATPSISANGATNGILWAVENASPAVLHAYQATNLATELYNSTQAPNGRDQFGPGNKYMTPTIANGKVYVGTPTGVAAFGLLAGGTCRSCRYDATVPDTSPARH
jgi:outer membrane protein assembly factor BamB